MALTTCKECGGQVSTEAKACPKCGADRSPTKYGCGTLIFLFIMAAILISAFKPDPPPKPPETPAQKAAREKADAAVNRAAIGARMLKKAMRNPDSFKLESALVMDDGAVCYTYRAQNGFGGMTRGHAALAADGKRFLNDNMDGFTRLWNRVCADKSGIEAATGINWFAL